MAFFVGRARLELAISFENTVLSRARIPIPPPTRRYFCQHLCPPTRDRTWDPLLKRQLLYQLSYGRTKAQKSDYTTIHKSFGMKFLKPVTHTGFELVFLP